MLVLLNYTYLLTYNTLFNNTNMLVCTINKEYLVYTLYVQYNSVYNIIEHTKMLYIINNSHVFNMM